MGAPAAILELAACGEPAAGAWLKQRSAETNLALMGAPAIVEVDSTWIAASS